MSNIENNFISWLKVKLTSLTIWLRICFVCLTAVFRNQFRSEKSISSAFHIMTMSLNMVSMKMSSFACPLRFFKPFFKMDNLHNRRA